MPTTPHPLTDLLTSVLEPVDAAILVGDVERGVIVACSAGAERLLGHAPGALIARPLAEVLARAEDREALTAEPPPRLSAASAAARERVPAPSWSFVHRDGSVITLAVAVTRVSASAERPAVVVLVLRAPASAEVPARRLTPVAVAAPPLGELALRDRVTGERAQLQLALDEKTREFHDFADTIAHDLAAPVRAIAALTQWLVTDCGDRLDAAGRETLALLRGRVQRIHTLVDGLRRLARSGDRHRALEVVDLGAVVSQTVTRMSAPEQVRIHLERPLPQVRGDARGLQVVFQNLLSNAIRFQDKPRGEVRIGYTALEDGWRFHVRDNGPGIAAPHREGVFSVFSTLTPRDDQDRAGVGLTIVRNIVERHGGRVWVESTPGEGSTFFFTMRRGLP